MSDLLQKIELNILERKLLTRGESLLAGVSGGLDSMVLLHLLHQLAAKHGWKLAVAHLNHKLRGRSSDADEKLVRKIAAHFKLPILVESADVNGFARSEKVSIEMAARKLRHEFLVRAARKNKSAKIALAHHADDQVELFFLRLLRGAGSEGLAGMNWRSPSPANTQFHVIRPLLDQTREAVQTYATENKVHFREDASNAQLDFQRNRIRHELLPLLKQYQPALHETVLRTRDIVAGESNFVSGAALDWLSNANPAPFDTLHTAVQRACLRLQMRMQGVPAEFELVEELRKKAARQIEIAPSTYIFRDVSGKIHLQQDKRVDFNPNEASVDLSVASNIQFDDLKIVWHIKNRRGAKFSPRPDCEWFDADKVGGHIVLRHWREGDRFQPIGMKSAAKIQDLFVNARIPREERRRKVVAVAENGEVFWVEGLRISERFKLDSATTRRLEWGWKYI